ncbi:hypothetical protein ACJZ2D_010296 [Fusarium nematophilum]
MPSPQLHSFAKFPFLARELQDLIWQWAVEDRPPAAHFSYLLFESFMTPIANAQRRSLFRKTVLEVLVPAPPPPDLVESPLPAIQFDILLQTCRSSRRIALRYRHGWEPERTLQLYKPDESEYGDDDDRHSLLNDQRDYSASEPPLAPVSGAEEGGRDSPPLNKHRFYLAPRMLDDLGCRLVDADRDLVILDNDWSSTTDEMRSALYRSRPEWGLPVQRARYLGLPWSPTSVSDAIDLFAIRRFRAEVLYIIISPEDLRGTGASRRPANPSRLGLEEPFLKREGAKRVLAEAPARFRYGKREYFTLSWDELDARAASSWHLRQLLFAVQRVRLGEDQTCDGCADPNCPKRVEGFPVAWKIMSWRDLD